MIPVLRPSLRLHAFLAAVSLMIAAVAPIANAEVAFTTLGPSDSFDAGSGQSISGSGTTLGYLSVANAFSPTVTGDLFSIELGITVAGDSGDIVLHLFGDDSTNNIPDVSVDLLSAPLTATTPFGTANPGLTTFTYAGPTITLLTGQTYWIALQPADSDTDVRVGSPGTELEFAL